MARTIADNRRASDEPLVRDRRHHDRSRPGPETKLLLRDPAGKLIAADLLDFSRRGLHIRYQGNYIRPGQELVISYLWGEVRTKVVWARIWQGSFEAGLVVQSHKVSDNRWSQQLAAAAGVPFSDE